MKADRINAILFLVSLILIMSIAWAAGANPESDVTPRTLFILLASVLFGIVVYIGARRNLRGRRLTRWGTTALSVPVALFISYLFWQDQDRECIIAQNNCRRLEIGMSHQIVAEIMGSPKRIWFDNRDLPVEEHWVYFDDPIMSSQIACSFDSVSRSLIGFTCGD